MRTDRQAPNGPSSKPALIHPLSAAPGSIRGDLALSNRENLVHASDSDVSAKRELGLWFPELS